nr:hypothetical protein [Tanacetum cinerariifolium]
MYDGDECDKGRMPTKIELTLEQSQQVKMEILLEPSSYKLLVGAEVEPLELGFEFDDQEWVEIGSFLFVRLEISSCGVAAFMEKNKEMWPFERPRDGIMVLTLKVRDTGCRLVFCFCSTWSGGPLCCKPDTQHSIIVAVVLEIVVVVIVGVAIVVTGGQAYAFHQDKASLVRVPVANVTMSSSAHLLRENTDSIRSDQRMRVSLDLRFLLGLLVFAMVAASASRAAAIPSEINCEIVA